VAGNLQSAATSITRRAPIDLMVPILICQGSIVVITLRVDASQAELAALHWS
jgi:hypothetical protein